MSQDARQPVGPAEDADAADALGVFSAATRAWFRAAFPGGPTRLQQRTWEAVSRGENVLAVAPTGSGKTLAAFLTAIDRLVTQAGGPPAPGPPGAPGAAHPGRGGAPGTAPAPGPEGPGRGVRVLYVSPLKALGVDVERNLRLPLAGIQAEAARLAVPGADPVGRRAAGGVRVGVRSGDTPPAERRRLRTTPPDILITTPESLYLMLTSAVRQTLRSVETVIVDEIHALAGDKRGTHLAVSLERLDDLLVGPAQRVGLSATVAPRERVARFLGGCHPVTVLAEELIEGASAAPEVTVSVPVADMTRVPAVLDRHERSRRAAGGRGRGPAAGPARPGRRAVRAGDQEAWRSDCALRAAVAGPGAGPGAGRGAQAAPGGVGVAGGVVDTSASSGDSRATVPTAVAATASIWPHIENAVLDQVLAHRSTLVFVRSRGLCERLTARLNEAWAARLAAGSAQAGRSGPQEGCPEDCQETHQDSQEAGTTQRAHPLGPGTPVIARAHHGSVSKEQRLAVERDLKEGRLRCVVATASLELGIDMGAIDLVLQVAPPPSVASGLQRVGRADHRVGGRPRGTIYPVERTQLLDAVVMAEGMRSGAVEHTRLVTNALDVLAQQTVAAVSMEDLDVEGWYATVRRCAPYADLPRSAFDSVLDMLSGGLTSADLAALSPRVVWDRRSGRLSARPGARRLAMAAPGTIPDRGMFPVVLPQDGQEAGRRRVGELDEEMVNESRPGDVITLGTSSWRIREITGDRVVVDPAAGRSSRLPFWRGEGPGRPAAVGAAKGAFLREAAQALSTSDEASGTGRPADASAPGGLDRLQARLAAAGLDASARDNLIALLREQRAATGILPCDTTLVLERYQEDDGGWRIILHSPYGRRVHEPWAVLVRERAHLLLGVTPQVLVADDGIVLQLPALRGDPPGPDLVTADPAGLSRLVRERIGTTALFASRFRECAARSLLMPSPRPGQRAPLWLQRLRSGQLLEASRHLAGLPVTVEAARECLEDVYDLPTLTDLMTRLAEGSIEVVEVLTHRPSPFARPLLLGYEAAFLYQEDLPRAERQASLLSLDPEAVAALLGEEGLTDLLDGVLASTDGSDPGGDPDDAEVVARTHAELQRLAAPRRVRADTEGVADLLRELGPLTAAEVAERCCLPVGQEVDGSGRGGADGCARAEVTRGRDKAVHGALAALAEAGRALPLLLGGCERWVRTEDARLLHQALGTALPDWVPSTPPVTSLDPGWQGGRADALLAGPEAGSRRRPPLDDLVLRMARTRVRTGAQECAQVLGAGQDVVTGCLQRLAQEGALVRLAGRDPAAWVEAGVLSRVRSRLLARARAAVQPVRPWALQELVTDLAGLVPAAQTRAPAGERSGEPDGSGGVQSAGAEDAAARGGPEALAEAMSLLEGAWLPPSLWESTVLPARVRGYRPSMLDELVASGEVVWQVRATDPGSRSPGTRAPGSLPRGVEVAFFPTDSPLAPVPGRVLEPDLPDEQRWQLVREGRATAGSFEPVRRALAPHHAPPPRRVRSRRARRTLVRPSSPVTGEPGGREAGGGQPGDGREILLTAAPWRRLGAAEASAEETAVALVESVLERYGVLCRETLQAGGATQGLATLMPVLRRMEETGSVLRGQFVEGLGPSQFARRDTVERLRQHGAQQAGAAPEGAEGVSRPVPLVVLDVKDPACLLGRGVPWPEPRLPPGLARHEAPTQPGSRATPSRRQGARVVLRTGEPVLYAAESLRSLVSYTASTQELALAVRVLVAQERRRLLGPGGTQQRVVVETVNGVSARSPAVAGLLGEAGLVRDPRGMRLRLSGSQVVGRP